MENNNISDADKELFRESVGDIRKIRQNTVFFKNTVRTQDRPVSPSQSSTKSSPGQPAGAETGHYLAGDFLSFKKPGIQNRVLSKLRRGQFPIEGSLDLHGMTANEAFRTLERFLEVSRIQNRRHLLIIHGKGKGSDTGRPVIKNKAFDWLSQHPDVLAFCSSRKSDGGTGAVYVLLRTNRARTD